MCERASVREKKKKKIRRFAPTSRILISSENRRGSRERRNDIRSTTARATASNADLSPRNSLGTRSRQLCGLKLTLCTCTPASRLPELEERWVRVQLFTARSHTISRPKTFYVPVSLLYSSRGTGVDEIYHELRLTGSVSLCREWQRVNAANVTSRARHARRLVPSWRIKTQWRVIYRACKPPSGDSIPTKSAEENDSARVEIEIPH